MSCNLCGNLIIPKKYEAIVTFRTYKNQAILMIFQIHEILCAFFIKKKVYNYYKFFKS